MGAHLDDDNAVNSGSVYIYELGTWTEQKLTASDGATADSFGCSVSIDGNYAIVGAYGDDDNGSNAGSVYVYELGTWTERKLTASDGATDDYFGASVSIDGNYAIVGAYGDDDNGSNAGSAYVYELGTWTEQKLTASDGAEGDQFGYSVSIDGNYAIVGAYGDDDNGSNAGSAYIYQYTDGVWTQKRWVLAHDGSEGDQFGCSVSIDGNYAIVGARNDDDNGSDSGSAYIFPTSNAPTGYQPGR